MENNYQPVIGLEVHVELKTGSKMFCSCSADYFGKEPNTHVCPVCLGLPGALPVPNKTAIEWCVMIGLTLNCKIPLFSKFDRKNYFYPDLPKGYQISQYDEPFAINGKIVIARSKMTKQSDSNEIATPDMHRDRNDTKEIRIRRVHMEEDTGKLIHAKVDGENVSLIDFNRSGVPLVEIVTEPDFENAEEVVEYLKKLQQIIRYLEVSNADMEKGDMRLEPNISVRKLTTELPPYKVEVKNINSFKFVDRAIHYEIERQTKILDSGNTPPQETRGWNESKNETTSQRSKEEAHDYRYFPEPDIPPIRWTDSQISNFKSQMPEMPWDKEKKLIDLGLSSYNAQVSTATIERAEFIEKAMKYSIAQDVDPQGAATFILNRLIDKINIIEPQQAVEEYKKQTTFAPIQTEELNSVVKAVLNENPKAVEDYKKGKTMAVMFLVGQVMKKIRKNVDANRVKEEIEKQLKTA